ncbi:hypothetical protein BN1221_04448 [Brenneria goodwinii]|uniref:Uncharacterized protein n=1 Tax=Brenneria goodwinii TaxID=1109412 RepID=A0A0G4K180_9GAMM|nr:hypothetical protein BN1221_04448 [Brenneria goodwinii]
MILIFIYSKYFAVIIDNNFYYHAYGLNKSSAYFVLFEHITEACHFPASVLL